MSTPFIRELISRMSIRPKPLFQGDVNSNDSCVINGNIGNEAIAEQTMPTQAPEASGEVENLVPSIGLLDPEGYVDMGVPWEEGSRGEKVCCCGMALGYLLMLCSVFAFRWPTTQSHLGSSDTEVR
jgi:hypothetical protein